MGSTVDGGSGESSLIVTVKVTSLLAGMVASNPIITVPGFLESAVAAGL